MPGRAKAVAFWAAVVLALGAVVGGVALAYAGYTDSSAPQGVVRGYFSALQRGDATAALGYGTIPDGTRTLLTAPVLREQERIAPLGAVRVQSVRTHGSRAQVVSQYTLAFAGSAQHVTQTFGLHRSDHTWHLDATALTAAIDLVGVAGQRANILGNPVPTRQVLLFPGAAPVTFATPNLQVQADTGYVPATGDPTVTITAEVTPPAGRQAVQAAVRALDACFGPGATAGIACPLPLGQYVPGSLRGSLSGDPTGALSASLATDNPNALTISGSVNFTGHYQRLDFNNRAHAGSGTVPIDVLASAPVTDPTKIVWTNQS